LRPEVVLLQWPGITTFSTHVARASGGGTFIHVEKLLPDRVSALHALQSVLPAQNQGEELLST
jgi:hypothetical protein